MKIKHTSNSLLLDVLSFGLLGVGTDDAFHRLSHVDDAVFFGSYEKERWGFRGRCGQAARLRWVMMDDGY